MESCGSENPGSFWEVATNIGMQRIMQSPLFAPRILVGRDQVVALRSDGPSWRQIGVRLDASYSAMRLPLPTRPVTGRFKTLFVFDHHRVSKQSHFRIPLCRFKNYWF